MPTGLSEMRDIMTVSDLAVQTRSVSHRPPVLQSSLQSAVTSVLWLQSRPVANPVAVSQPPPPPPPPAPTGSDIRHSVWRDVISDQITAGLTPASYLIKY